MTIFNFLEFALSPKPLIGKKIVITAGPTQEKIDPVRFIGNHSSGKMGLAIAKICSFRGAEVSLIMGPHSLNIETLPNLNIIDVVSTEEMNLAFRKECESANVVIFAAAVADYKPKQSLDQKIKKQENELILDLERTIDIAKSFSFIKKEEQYSVGFALETNNEELMAKEKLVKKNTYPL